MNQNLVRYIGVAGLLPEHITELCLFYESLVLDFPKSKQAPIPFSWITNIKKIFERGRNES